MRGERCSLICGPAKESAKANHRSLNGEDLIRLEWQAHFYRHFHTSFIKDSGRGPRRRSPSRKIDFSLAASVELCVAGVTPDWGMKRRYGESKR